MKLFFLWCATLTLATSPVWSQSDDQNKDFYAPQTFKQHLAYQQGLFTPSGSNNVEPERRSWQEPQVRETEPWRSPTASKEQKAAILHHKQALSADGKFRYEFKADNGVAAGEEISPDGTRTGAFQYKDPNGELVTLKYRAGKEGFQILEGSHLPKSPEPVAYNQQDDHYQRAYNQQKQQYQLQQQYNQQAPGYIQPKQYNQQSGPAQIFNQQYQYFRPQQQLYTQQGGQGEQGGLGGEGRQGGQEGEGQGGRQNQGAGNQYFVQNWAGVGNNGGPEDDGQYRENDVEDQRQGQSGSYERIPHSFGEGYSFEFAG